jgi:signal transduction histidine kinase/Tfp pilus assembly protein PilF
VFLVLLLLLISPEETNSDTTRINRYNRVVFSIRETHLDSALTLSLQAQKLADSLAYTRGLAQALENTGWIYYRKGNFGKSVECSYQALKLAVDLRDTVQMANLYNNIGAVYYAQKQYAVALEEFRKGLHLAVRSKHARSHTRSINNMSYMFFMLAQYDSAEHYSNQAMLLAKEGSWYTASFAYRNQGDIYRATGRKEAALKSFEKAMELAQKGGALSMQVATRPRIASLLVEFGQVKQGIAMLEENIRIAREKGFDEELLQTYKALAIAWYNQKAYEQAARVQSQLIALNDSISARKWSNQLASLEALYELDLKETRIELLTKESELNKAIIFRQRVLLWGVSIGFVIIALAGILFWNNTRKLRLAKKAIESHERELTIRNQEIEQQRQQLERLNATKDKLFSIIGHDFRSPLQSLRGLLALMNQNSLTPQEFAHYSKDLKGRIDIVYDNLDNLLHWSVAQINGIKTNLQIVPVRTLFKDVTELYQEAAVQKKVVIETNLKDEVLVLADNDQLKLVLRNLVSNAIKFSNTHGTVVLGAEVSGTEACLYVKDNGLGIDPANLQRLFVKDSLWSQRGTHQEKGLGIGLLLCKEFLEKNSSRLEVSSERGKGTTFSFRLLLAGAESVPSKKQVASLL